MGAFISAVIGYILGNINPAYVIGRLHGYDVRRDGSGNAGASNAFILAGKWAFLITTAIDILKAAAAWWICAALFPGLGTAGPIGGVACLLGHMYPVLLGFMGGKGLSCLGGLILAWKPWLFPVALLLAAVIVFGTGYMCFAAPSVSLLLPLTHFLMERDMAAALILLIPAVPIFWKHRVNFRRVLEGKEARMSYLWNKDRELERIGRKDAVK